MNMSNIENAATITAEQPKVEAKEQRQPKVLKAKKPVAKQLEPIAEGVKAERKVEHVGIKKARAWFSVSPSAKDGRRFQMEQTFDFSGVTDEEMIELALATVIIAVQGMFRAMPDAERLNADNWREPIDVKRDVVSRQRAPRTIGKTSEIRRLMNEAGLSDDDVLELLRKANNGKK